MPQMMPLNWFFLMIYFLMIYILINLLIMFFVKHFFNNKNFIKKFNKLNFFKWL